MLTSKPSRALAAAALSLGLATGLSACGAPQTLHSYTPAEGTQLDAKVQGTVPLKLRNVMILSRAEGKGSLVGSIIAPRADTLQGVAGQVVTFDGQPGAQLGPVTTSIRVPANEAVNLLKQPAIELDAADLAPGQTADLVLQFAQAGPVRLRVPVVDGTKADYRTATPMPAPSSTQPSTATDATPAPTASPS